MNSKIIIGTGLIIFGTFILSMLVTTWALMRSDYGEVEVHMTVCETPECWGNTSTLGYNGTARIDGTAYGDVAFCVYSKDKDISDVFNICAHEWAHTHEGLRD
jgi:hypothetical protein